MKRAVFIIYIMVTAITGNAASWILSGTVADADNGEELPFSSISVTPGNHTAVADADGNFALALPAGRYTVSVRYIGYDTKTVTVDLTSARKIRIKLRPQQQQLKEVVITARDGDALSSSSRIDRSAMEHLQPTSFTDLLELLPGNISHDPDMGSANTITLRETGTMTATGSRSVNDDYAITSLGTQFMIDGAPIGTDANMQAIPAGDTSDPSYKRNVMNKGVDMRTISTDNIESVEVVRGIPSAEYGNLTSGLVNIKRIHRSTPLTARFKADQYSKLFSVSKGIGLGGNVINLDAGYLDSKVDPRNNLENYKRINVAVRPTLRFRSSALNTSWTIGVDYSGSFDNAKTDPDLNYNKIDEFKSSYNRYAFVNDINFAFNHCRWLDNIALNAAADYTYDHLTRRKQVAPQRASVAPSTMDEGVHDGRYLLSEYISDFEIDGKPVNINLRLKANGKASRGVMLTQYKAGIEWSFAKNYGRGQVYDLARPLSASWTTRPRAFKDIPSLQVMSGFIEDELTVNAGPTKGELRMGMRAISLPALDSRYDISGKVYLDPRANISWRFPIADGIRPLSVTIGGGWGLTTRMPTIDYLFPQCHYNDLLQLNYYDAANPLEHSRINLRTYKVDATNYHIRPARNHKWEVRLGAEFGANKLSVTYFREHMTDGFRYTPVYRPYRYRKYDASAIDPAALTGPPSLDNLPYEDVTVLDGFRMASNGSRIDKQGIEYQISTERWIPLRTALIINGAWFRTRYSNSQMLYSTVNDVVGNQAVSDMYVGIYDTNDGRICEQFNTNFMFDTQIPQWGLVFSTTVQCMWYVKTTRMRDNTTPAQYISAADGKIHEYTPEAVAADPMLQYLVKSYNEDSYRTMRIPTAVYLNLKATKKIGRWLKVSAFVNRIVDYLPDYKSNGLTVRRYSDAYFGMEATVTI